MDLFVGGGSVFYETQSRHQDKLTYVLNDGSGPLITFYQVLKERAKELIALWSVDQATRIPAAEAKEKFCLYRETLIKELWSQPTTVQAYRYLYVNRCSFSGAGLYGGFSSDAYWNRYLKPPLDQLLQQASAALKDAVITSSDWQACLDFWDSEGSFFFIDPPYYEIKSLYGPHVVNHRELAASLKDTDAKWLVTLNDHPDVRKMFRYAHIAPMDVQYGMTNCSRGNVARVGKELIITNYEVPRCP